MVKTGGEAGADDVGAQDKGATSGSTGGETLHTTRPAQGAPAGEQAGEGPASAAAWDRARAANKRTWLDNRQDNGDLGDMAQQDRTTLVTASAIFNRLGYLWCPSRKRDHSSYAHREICCNDSAHRYAKEIQSLLQETAIRIT